MTVEDYEQQRRSDRIEKAQALAAIIGCIVLLFLLGAAGWGCESWTCGRSWKRSGMKTSWGPVQGCLVEVAPGRWIPEDRVRALP